MPLIPAVWPYIFRFHRSVTRPLANWSKTNTTLSLVGMALRICRLPMIRIARM